MQSKAAFMRLFPYRRKAARKGSRSFGRTRSKESSRARRLIDLCVTSVSSASLRFIDRRIYRRDAEDTEVTQRIKLLAGAQKDLPLSLIHISEPTRLLSISYA